MAELKQLSQLGIESDSSGLGIGVQTDTSYLRESNVRKTELLSNAIDKGSKIFGEIKADEIATDAQAAAEGFFQEKKALATEIDDLTRRSESLSGQEDEDEFLSDDATLGIGKRIAELRRKQGQMSSSHFELMVDTMRNQDMVKYPWMEKRIASEYGDITGRTKTVVGLLAAQEKSDAKIAEKVHSTAIAGLTTAGLAVTGDTATDVNTWETFKSSVASSKLQREQGTSKGGHAKFVSDRPGNINFASFGMAGIFNQARLSGRGEEGAIAIESFINNEVAELGIRYGDSVSASTYANHKAILEAKGLAMTKYLRGTTDLDKLNRENALVDAANKSAINNIPALKAASALSTNLGDSMTDAIYRNLVGNSALTEAIDEYAIQLGTGNADVVSDTMLNFSKEERGATLRYMSANYGAWLGSPDLPPLSREVFLTSMNTHAKSMIDGKNWYPDQMNTFLKSASDPRFGAMINAPDVGGVIDSVFPDLSSYEEASILAMDTTMESTISSLAQKKVGTGLAGIGLDIMYKDYVEGVVKEDGTLTLVTRDLDSLKDIYLGDALGMNTAQNEIKEWVDKQNRTNIATFNGAAKTRGIIHGGGEEMIYSSTMKKLNEFGITNTIPIRDLVGGELPEGTIAGGEVTNQEIVARDGETIVRGNNRMGAVQGMDDARSRGVVPEGVLTDEARASREVNQLFGGDMGAPNPNEFVSNRPAQPQPSAISQLPEATGEVTGNTPPSRVLPEVTIDRNLQGDVPNPQGATQSAVPFPSVGDLFEPEELKKMTGEEAPQVQGAFDPSVHMWWLDNYNADKKNRDSVSKSSYRNVKQVLTSPTKKQSRNMREMSNIVRSSLDVFDGEMNKFGTTEADLQTFIAHTYAAETKAGTSSSKLSETGAAGELQILPSTALSLMGRSGSGSKAIFGPKAAARSGFDIEKFVSSDEKAQQQMLIDNKVANALFAIAKFFERKYVGK